jgi:hypothetical protein
MWNDYVFTPILGRGTQTPATVNMSGILSLLSRFEGTVRQDSPRPAANPDDNNNSHSGDSGDENGSGASNSGSSADA